MSYKNGFYWNIALNLDDLDFDDLIDRDQKWVKNNMKIMEGDEDASMKRIKKMIQIRRDKLYRKCYKCGYPSKKKCSVCRGPYYCSEKCQLEDWPEHKVCCTHKYRYGFDYTEEEASDPESDSSESNVDVDVDG